MFLFEISHAQLGKGTEGYVLGLTYFLTTSSCNLVWMFSMQT